MKYKKKSLTRVANGDILNQTLKDRGGPGEKGQFYPEKGPMGSLCRSKGLGVFVWCGGLNEQCPP